MTKISVCIATYNGEKYIKEQLDSILNQLKSDDEVIISDDGSIDNTLSLIEDYRDKRIKLLHHLPKKGKYKFSLTTYNFENALQMAKGEYVFFADQDDIWRENKVTECIKKMQQGYDLVLHDATVIDEHENVIFESYFKVNRSHQGLMENIINNSYLGCCMVINRKYLNKILPFPETPIPHDLWIGMLYGYYGKVFFLEQKLLFYRRHGGNVSPSSEKSVNSIMFKLRYRANFIFAMLKRMM